MLNKFNTSREVLLLHPPGWSLNYGSPHLGLPLIQGYLIGKGIPCSIRDLNIESSQYYGINISRKTILNFSHNSFDVVEADKIYYSTVDQLKCIGEEFNGSWRIKSGFNFHGCDLSKSEDVREFSNCKSPFTNFYNKVVIPYVKKKPPLIIGFSVTVPNQILSAFELIRILRSAGYDGTIILGGNIPTRLKKEFQKKWIFDLIDGLVTTQGEESIELLWKTVSRGVYNFEEIPNLLWRDKKGEPVSNPYKKLDIVDFSMPDFKGYPIGDYWGINYLPILGARGCYYGKCSFCPIPFAWGNNGFVGFDKVEKVADFLTQASERYNINNYSFIEEAMHAKQLAKLSKIIIENGNNIRFEGYVRLDKTWGESKLLSVFQKAGLKKVFIGMELINFSGRSGMNKKDNIGDILDYLKSFYDHGIKVHLFNMFGYPGTTEDDAMATIEFVLKHKKYIETVDISHFVYARHTNVNSVTPIITCERDWALEYDYKNLDNKDLTSTQSKLLANSLESIIIQEQPQWVNPVYRMFSTWTEKNKITRGNYEIRTSIQRKTNSDIRKTSKNRSKAIYKTKDRPKSLLV